MRFNIDFIYKRHKFLKLCDISYIVNITLLKNAYIAYTDNANTNLLRTFVKSTYTYMLDLDTHLLFLNKD